MPVNIIIKQFEEILEVERNARDYYNYLLGKIKDAEVKEVLESIRDDEMKHMELAKKAIGILKN